MLHFDGSNKMLYSNLKGIEVKKIRQKKKNPTVYCRSRKCVANFDEISVKNRCIFLLKYIKSMGHISGSNEVSIQKIINNSLKLWKNAILKMSYTANRELYTAISHILRFHEIWSIAFFVSLCKFQFATSLRSKKSFKRLMSESHSYCHCKHESM